MFFSYTDDEAEYLRSKDKRLAAVMDVVGPVRRTAEPDVFAALVHSITGQQISGAAHRTVWERMKAGLGAITPESIDKAGAAAIKEFGISFRKSEYIAGLARKVLSGEFDVGALHGMDDEQAINRLCALNGVGRWTAEMILIFSLQRRDVLSYGDFGIRRGLRMLYRHRELTPQLFERYRKRFSPCGSLASLYIWEAAGGAIPCLSDPGDEGRRAKNRKRSVSA